MASGSGNDQDTTAPLVETAGTLDLEVNVLLEFYCMRDRVPTKVPQMPEQVRNLHETYSVGHIEDIVLEHGTTIRTILQKDQLYRITDIITSVYDDTTGERLLHFLKIKRRFNRVWWDLCPTEVYPKRQNWPLDPPKIYVMLDDNPDREIPEHDGDPERIRVKRWQEDAVIQRRLKNESPLINDDILNIKPCIQPVVDPTTPAVPAVEARQGEQRHLLFGDVLRWTHDIPHH